MDDRAHSTGAAARHRGIAQLGQVHAGAPLLDGRIHPGGVAGGGTLQEGGVYRQSELFVADPRRRRPTRNAGNYRHLMGIDTGTRR